jgi:hypothetical protein
MKSNMYFLKAISQSYCNRRVLSIHVSFLYNLNSITLLLDDFGRSNTSIYYT